MDDSKFWINIWSLAAAVSIVLIGACAAVSFDTKNKWEKAVSNGADPMVVSCALNISSNSSHGDAIICNTLAQNRK